MFLVSNFPGNNNMFTYSVTNLAMWMAASLSADLGVGLMTTEVNVQQMTLTNLMEVSPQRLHQQPTCCHDEI